jgi:hypothetical protein
MLNDDETRSLEALARAPDGCAEAVLLADGFTIKQLSGLVAPVIENDGNF